MSVLSVLCLVMDRKLFKPQEMGLTPASQCEGPPGPPRSLGLLAKQIPQETEIQDGQRAPAFSKEQPKSSPPPCCPPRGKSMGQLSLCACFSGCETASSKVCSAAQSNIQRLVLEKRRRTRARAESRQNRQGRRQQKKWARRGGTRRTQYRMVTPGSLHPPRSFL